MRIAVHRTTWDFDELADAWEIKDREKKDLRRLVEQGVLRPYSTMSCVLQPLVVAGGGEPLAAGEPVEFRGDLWLAQEHAIKVGNLEYAYPALRDARQPGDGVRYWAPPVTLTLSLALGNFVVSDENRAEIEEAESWRHDVLADTLSTRKERTRDLIIANLAMEALGWDPASDRSEGVTRLVSIGQAHGLPVSYNTAKEHLRLVWDRCPPQLAPSGDAVKPYQQTVVRPIKRSIN